MRFSEWRMPNDAVRISKPISHTPRVVVTRQLMPAVEARMNELFDAELNTTDTPLTREQLVEAMQLADVLVQL